MNPVMILDCTVRDGGYLNNWSFPLHVVRDIYESVSKAGVDYFEIGYLDESEKPGLGPWKSCNTELIDSVVRGSRGAKIAAMLEMDTLQPFVEQKRFVKGVDLVRVALHRNQVDQALPLFSYLKECGYSTSLQLMGITGFSEDSLNSLSKAIMACGSVDIVYIGDSYGSLTPDSIQSIVGKLQDAGIEKIGFHPHNNLQMALANSLEAIRNGVSMIDGSLFGMGRASGNLPLESVVACLGKVVQDKYNLLPLLECIDRHFIKLQKEFPWGYSLPYLLSGVFECHPYYMRDLVDYQEFSIEDIFKVAKKINKLSPVGYSRELLESLISEGFIESGVNEEFTAPPVQLNGKQSQSTVSYSNRHIGRDFLILANGPNLNEYHDKIRTFIDMYNPVVIGSNYLGELFIPDYHMFSNKKRLWTYGHTVNTASKLLISSNIDAITLNTVIDREYEVVPIIDSHTAPFDIVDGVIQCNCRTVSILAIAVAMQMGARRIFVAGLDGYLNYDSVYHFYTEEESESREVVQRKHYDSYRYLMEIDAFFKQAGYEGVNILTPTSYEKMYRGIDNYLLDGGIL